MNKETCCTHCDGGCAEWVEWVGHVIHGPDGKILAVWASGHCPACAERDTIADMCEEVFVGLLSLILGDEEAATAGPERLPDHDARAQTWQAAANLARGQR